MEDTFEKDVLAARPSLRAFAISLSGNGDRADDLVQETMLRAFANKSSFQIGSNMPAWLFTILRNLFLSDYRKRRREVEDVEETYSKTLKTKPSQDHYMEFEDLKAALQKLPADQYEAIMLIGASGFSYDDAAMICECAIGTIKSRVNRARSKLHALLDAFDLRELNKKSWDEPDDEAFFGTEFKSRHSGRKHPDTALPKYSPLAARQRRESIRQEQRKRQENGRVAVIFSPTDTSTIEAAAKTLEVVSSTTKSITVQLPEPKTIIFEGLLFVSMGTSTLPSGEIQELYQIA